MTQIPVSHSFGLEWAHELEEGILQNLNAISCMELIPENFFEGRFESFLSTLRKNNTPVAVHGILLSIGAMEPLKQDHLDKVLEVADKVNIVNYSEHLSLTSVGDFDIDALTPLAYTEEVADHVCRKVEQIQKQINVPFLLENVSWRFVIPESDFSEPQFINRIIERTGCGLVLDVTNVYTNSVNFNFDPLQYIDELNLDAVRLVHLAGGYYDREGFLMDSHDNAVAKESWELYSYVLKKAPPFMTIIERTGSFPKIEDLLTELGVAKQLASLADIQSNTRQKLAVPTGASAQAY